MGSIVSHYYKKLIYENIIIILQAILIYEISKYPQFLTLIPCIIP